MDLHSRYNGIVRHLRVYGGRNQRLDVRRDGLRVCESVDEDRGVRCLVFGGVDASAFQNGHLDLSVKNYETKEGATMT